MSETLKLKLTDIIIGPRQRIDLGDLTDLDSMGDPEVGQIQPIIVDGSNILIAGRRRLAKATQLNWESIEVVRRDNISEPQKQLMEFCEDVARKNRTWQELCVATYKLNRLLKTEKAIQGQRWTERAMATFTGLPNSNIHYMLVVGEALLVLPKDEPLWETENYTAAIQLLLTRKDDEIIAEMTRRAELNKATPPSPSPNGVAQEQSITEEGMEEYVEKEKQPNVVTFHGQNNHLAALNSPATLAICYAKSRLDPTKDLLMSWFENASQVVIWGLAPYRIQEWMELAESVGWSALTYPLIWDKCELFPLIAAPFSPNYTMGLVLEKRSGSLVVNEAPSKSVVSSFPNDPTDSLPLAVIDFTLQALTQPGDRVLLIHQTSPKQVAECGRIPVWFEPDPEVFERKKAALLNFYMEADPTTIIQGL